MKRLKRNSLVTVILVVLVFTLCSVLLVGCGDNNDPTPEHPTADIKLNVTNVTLALGRTRKMVLTADDAEVEAAWSVSGNSVTVKDGVVTAVSVGESVVTAAYNEKTYNCTVTVVAPDVIPLFEFDRETLVLKKGNEFNLSPTLYYGGEYLPLDANASYTSADRSVVDTVELADGSLKLVAVSVSETPVNVIAEYVWNGVMLSDEILVTVEENSLIKLSENNVTLSAYDYYEDAVFEAQLAVDFVMNKGAAVSSPAVTWSIEDENIAAIDANGKVVAKGAGITYACATWTNGTDTAKAYCKVSVEETQFDFTGSGLIRMLADDPNGKNVIKLADYPVNITSDMITTVLDITHSEELAISFTEADGKLLLDGSDLQAGKRIISVGIAGKFKIIFKVEVLRDKNQQPSLEEVSFSGVDSEYVGEFEGEDYVWRMKSTNSTNARFNIDLGDITEYDYVDVKYYFADTSVLPSNTTHPNGMLFTGNVCTGNTTNHPHNSSKEEGYFIGIDTYKYVKALYVDENGNPTTIHNGWNIIRIYMVDELESAYIQVNQKNIEYYVCSVVTYGND